MQLEQLPGYDAPELNPDEGIWKHLKYVELKNVCCRSLSELRSELRKAKERLKKVTSSLAALGSIIRALSMCAENSNGCKRRTRTWDPGHFR